MRWVLETPPFDQNNGDFLDFAICRSQNLMHAKNDCEKFLMHEGPEDWKLDVS